MTLDEDVCWELLATEPHGTLGTVHATRGVDATPVVFALLPGGRIVVPVDTVKPKRTTRLQRVVNLELDSRCVLLVDHYEQDWSQLWWVRVHAVAELARATPEVAEALAGRFAPYQAAGSIVAAIILNPAVISGWSANPR